MKKGKLKIHGAYIIFILIVIIICLLTIKFGKDDNVIDYVSFAATISSILLAVVAIIYSFFSNSDLSKVLGSLDSVSKDVVKNTVEMTKTAENLRVKVEEIPGFLKPIEEKTDITNSRLEQLAKNTNGVTSKGIDEETKKDFLKVNSFTGTRALYCCALAFQKKKEFAFKSISGISSEDQNYMYGYMVATSSLGLLDYKTTTENRFEITEIDDFIVKNIKAKISEKAKRHEHWKSEVESIEAFFD